MSWSHLKSLDRLLYSSIITLLTWVHCFPSKDQWYPPHIMHFFSISIILHSKIESILQKGHQRDANYQKKKSAPYTGH